MKGQKILKVTSILMIIGGIIAAIAGVIAILGVSALAALSGSAEGTGLLLAIISIIIGLVGGGQFSITSLVLNLLLPGLYVYGAMQMKGTA